MHLPSGEEDFDGHVMANVEMSTRHDESNSHLQTAKPKTITLKNEKKITKKQSYNINFGKRRSKRLTTKETRRKKEKTKRSKNERIIKDIEKNYQIKQVDLEEDNLLEKQEEDKTKKKRNGKCVGTKRSWDPRSRTKRKEEERRRRRRRR